jgi:hypothetical protein
MSMNAGPAERPLTAEEFAQAAWSEGDAYAITLPAHALQGLLDEIHRLRGVEAQLRTLETLVSSQVEVAIKYEGQDAPPARKL